MSFLTVLLGLRNRKILAKILRFDYVKIPYACLSDSSVFGQSTTLFTSVSAFFPRIISLTFVWPLDCSPGEVFADEGYIVLSAFPFPTNLPLVDGFPNARCGYWSETLL